MRSVGAFWKHPRHLLQLAVLLVTLAIGVQFWVYVHQAGGDGAIQVARPPGVEGFLPIGALMGWKRFLWTGQWDALHPAAMVIFGWAVLLSLLFRKAFCGWFCPVGTVSEGLWKTGRRLIGRNFRTPRWLDITLRSLKYGLLGFFIWAIGMMGLAQMDAFARSDYYRLADVKMLFFFTRMSLLTAGVLAVLVLLSVLFKNFWCRYLCPYGALLGLAALASPTRVKRRPNSCIDCGRCERACAADLPVARKAAVRSAECTGCMACVEACPVAQTLTFSTRGLTDRFWSVGKVAVSIGLFFILTYYLANITGHWRGATSDMQLRARLRTIDAPANTHPSFADMTDDN